MRPPRGCCVFIRRICLLGTEERAGKVHAHDFGPLLVTQIFQWNRGAFTPALLKRTSSRPNLSRVPANKARTESGWRTSVEMGSTQAPGWISHGRCLLQLRRTPPGQRYRISGRLHRQGDRPSYTAARPGNDRYLAVHALCSLRARLHLLSFSSAIWHKSDSGCSNVPFVPARSPGDGMPRDKSWCEGTRS